MFSKRFELLLGVCALFAVNPVQAESEGLLAEWRFDEGQGDVALDHSANANHGEIWGADWVKGPFGTALHFDGRGAHVAVPELPGLNKSDAMSVEAWVYWEGTGRYPNIVSGGTWSPGGFLLFVQDNRCSFRMGRPDVSASLDRERWREVGVDLLAPFQLGRWYHLVATFQRPVIRTYVDGQLVSSAKWDYPVAHRRQLMIGKWSGSVGHKGLIDHVRIFNRALSQDEIGAEFRRQTGKYNAANSERPAYLKIPRETQVARAAATFENRFAKLAVSSIGRCIALIDKNTGEDRLQRSSPFVTVKRDGTVFTPDGCSVEQGRLVFRFKRAQTNVAVSVRAEPEYFVFRIESISTQDVDEVSFARLRLKRCRYVHPMSGLAADDQFAVCLRTLNLKTNVQIVGNPPELKATVSREPGLEDGGAAVVAGPRAHLRRVLQDVVRNEGLPYSALGGPFAQDAEQNRGSYIFARVSEQNVDQWIEFARQGAIDTVHLLGWQQTLGHYAPREDLFPHGLEGLTEVVGKLHAAGLKAGMHTLTGCISTHDPWVRPSPDRRLATDGTFVLKTDIGAGDTSVNTLQPPGDYSTVWAYSSRGNCIRIDDELILYSAISNKPPLGFSNCQRGAFGTKATAHKKGASVHHLIARYGCFVPDENSTLVEEVAAKIARVYNTCGFDQIYMDGAEAMRGWYGIARMRHAIYTRLKRPALVEASCWDHHSWPFHSRIGAWDHPKWGLKRFADEHLRAVEQYRDGSLLEAQLGWWVILGPARDWDMEMPDEIEYLCAKALGHDVPLSFQNVTVDGEPQNARQDEYVTTIGRYERLRLANYFTDSLKKTLQEPRQEFRLTQAKEGQWQILRTDYQRHKVTGPANSAATWSINNRYASQPAKLRIAALYAALPYDDPHSVELADFSNEGEFTPAGAAPKMTLNISPVRNRPSARPTDVPAELGRLAGTNDAESPVGSWARAAKHFEPVVDLTPYDAIGLWVCGDGKDELLNLQLTNLPEYFRTLDDHHIRIDFKGWRYFELLLRERDASGYHDYQWPYGAHCVLHRSPLVRAVVNKLTVYLNNVPAKDDVSCILSPIRALRTQKVRVRNPSIEIGDRRITFPVDLESGMYIEFESPRDCRVYDEHGNVLRRLRPSGDALTLAAGDNQIKYACEGSDGFRLRSEITVISHGTPIQDRRPVSEIDWTLLRREYEFPRTICTLDGKQNRWHVPCRSDAEFADLEIEFRVDQVGDKLAMYNSASAIVLEEFEDTARSFVYDTQLTESGCSPSVQQRLTHTLDMVKVGSGGACYSASSARDDNGGWSVKGKRLTEPLDLSGLATIGFWLHGDARGEQFKLQLRDAAGGWQDMVTRVDFSGWRFCQFDIGGPRLKDKSRIVALNMYFNGLPAGQTVTCFVDAVLAMPKPLPLCDPALVVAGERLVFPVTMDAGDRLVFKSMSNCKLYCASGGRELVVPTGANLRLRPGSSLVEFTCVPPNPGGFRVAAKLTKVYP